MAMDKVQEAIARAIALRGERYYTSPREDKEAAEGMSAAFSSVAAEEGVDEDQLAEVLLAGDEYALCTLYQAACTDLSCASRVIRDAWSPPVRATWVGPRGERSEDHRIAKWD